MRPERPPPTARHVAGLGRRRRLQRRGPRGGGRRTRRSRRPTPATTAHSGRELRERPLPDALPFGDQRPERRRVRRVAEEPEDAVRREAEPDPRRDRVRRTAAATSGQSWASASRPAISEPGCRFAQSALTTRIGIVRRPASAGRSSSSAKSGRSASVKQVGTHAQARHREGEVDRERHERERDRASCAAARGARPRGTRPRTRRRARCGSRRRRRCGRGPRTRRRRATPGDRAVPTGRWLKGSASGNPCATRRCPSARCQWKSMSSERGGAAQETRDQNTARLHEPPCRHGAAGRPRFLVPGRGPGL